MKYFLPVFIIVPALEIGLFILTGQAIGSFATVALIILTGILGAVLAKKEGLGIIRKMQEQVRFGQPPGDALLEGFCILIGGLLLLMPGFITDAAGLILLFPPARKLFKPLLLKWFKNWVSKRHIYIYR
ncbi:FxsA family protein [Siminovitchia sp. 179-K 8D1 HS]|uniref:FxsA family protein n=1 Tax=Siminovitchia sp. 179-K 8D1 HS TaxID=3142385 RepID=UPI0039A2951A